MTPKSNETATYSVESKMHHNVDVKDSSHNKQFAAYKISLYHTHTHTHTRIAVTQFEQHLAERRWMWPGRAVGEMDDCRQPTQWMRLAAQGDRSTLMSDCQTQTHTLKQVNEAL